MPSLIVQRNQADYIGAFAEPAFALWGQGAQIMSGLYSALREHRTPLSAFRVVNDESPASEGIVVTISPQTTLRFRLDRIEATLQNFLESELARLPGVLSGVDAWLRAAVPGFRVSNHLLSYAAHASLSEGTSRDYLLRLTDVSLPKLGVNTGTGLIYHFDLPDRGWNLQLSIDYSYTVANGLYVYFLAFLQADVVDFAATVRDVRAILEQALQSVDLRLVGEQDANQSHT